MDRRTFLESIGTVSAAGLMAAPLSNEATAVDRHRCQSPTDGHTKSWLFWDLWHLDRITNLDLQQGQPKWRPEGTYVDPLMYGHNSWPTVYRDQATDRWRMLYSISWKPYQLMLAESDDGIRWRPAPHRVKS